MNDDTPLDMSARAAGESEFARMRVMLAARHAADAIRRRTLLEQDHVLVKRDPKDVAGAIALGFVLVGRGLRAVDSWRLDGLLGESVDELIERLRTASTHLPNRDAGAVLVRAIDLGVAELNAKGEYAAWRRRADRYFTEHDEWLAADGALRESGEWRFLGMTSGQQELVRATCALVELDLPGHVLRGSAHDWLERKRANLLYRGVRT